MADPPPFSGESIPDPQLPPGENLDALPPTLGETAHDLPLPLVENVANAGKTAAEAPCPVKPIVETPPGLQAETVAAEEHSHVSKTKKKAKKSYESVVALLAQNQEVAYELEMAQNQIDEDRTQFRQAVADVHRKHRKQLKTLFDRRNILLQNVPNFWRTAVKNHPIIGSILTEADKDFFRYVTRVEVDSREENVFNFKIRFHLDYNPYLENKVIMKDFHLTACPQFCRVTNLKFKKNVLDEFKFLDKKRSSRSFIGYKSFFAWLTDNKTPRRDDIAHYFRFDLQLNPMYYYVNKPVHLEGTTKKKCHHKTKYPVSVKREVKKRKKRGRRPRK
ncbi:hypothetical protein QR680_000185 [Steinernema hermaphroditum]|uniref:Uncharacterized protein n=1 Tax=Steinernema hermaphroditum TaxID=289476 RepID=A0AA39GTR0_9BILA|nr:hypothetical protein QR680_000185 [Steinernema hermaphroditum]